MSQPFFSLSARQDLLDIFEFVARDKPSAAIRWIVRLEQECLLLATNPTIGTSRDDLVPKLRCWSVEDYVICFRSSQDGVEIVRVLHGSRDINSLFRG